MILVSFNGTFDRNNPLHKFILISYSMVATNIIIFLFFYLLKNQNSRSKSMNRVHPNRQQGVQTKCIFPFFGGHHLLMYLCVSVHVSAHLGTNTLHIIAPPPFKYLSYIKGLFGLYYGVIPISNPLCCLELVKKFVVGGQVVVVLCKPILVFSLGFDQADQLETFSKCLGLPDC